jgi:DNA helicase II / ATP-dependent DNA helicase PcrA
MNLRSKVSEGFSLNIGAGLRSVAMQKIFMTDYTINDLLPHVKVDTKSDDSVRTIHSAKGTEFNNTLVHFESLADFKKYILNAAEYLDHEDDHGRIYYVALAGPKRDSL